MPLIIKDTYVPAPPQKFPKVLGLGSDLPGFLLATLIFVLAGEHNYSHMVSVKEHERRGYGRSSEHR